MISTENGNIIKSTNYKLNVFHLWAAAREVEQRLEKYQYQALDKTLREEEFCPQCHKHVIAWFLVKFRNN